VAVLVLLQEVNLLNVYCSLQGPDMLCQLSV